MRYYLDPVAKAAVLKAFDTNWHASCFDLCAAMTGLKGSLPEIRK
jgi:hypothetical protein